MRTVGREDQLQKVCLLASKFSLGAMGLFETADTLLLSMVEREVPERAVVMRPRTESSPC